MVATRRLRQQAAPRAIRVLGGTTEVGLDPLMNQKSAPSTSPHNPHSEQDPPQCAWPERGHCVRA